MARVRTSPKSRANAKRRGKATAQRATARRSATARTAARAAPPARTAARAAPPARAARNLAAGTRTSAPAATAPSTRAATARSAPAAPAGAGKAAPSTRAATARSAPADAGKAAPSTRAATARSAPAARTGAGKAAPSTRTPAGKTRGTRGESPAASRPARRPPAAQLSGGSSVVKVLESKQPIEALRRFLAQIPGEATREQGQIALGSAQLMLLPIAHEHRGGREVKLLLDLVLARWDAFPDRSGFHAQEFLRNAFAAVGDDRERIARLSALVPADATSELRFNMAGAHAAAGDRPAMLRALEAALAAGATAAQVRRDPDLARFLDDPAVIALLDRAAAPAIPVDVAPYVAPVRAALESVIGTLREIGGPSRLEPPATLDAVLAAERASRIQLPNDYRALLTISDGVALWDHELFGTRDLRGDTGLAHRAREFLAMSASYGGIGMDACVPLASWGRPDHWLLYDPRGVVRDGTPGYVVMLTADPSPVTDLADALRKLEDAVRDVLATN